MGVHALPGETPADFTDPAHVWELLGDDARPDRAELVRHAVYNFRSLIADSLQVGRVLLAGDAAHVMPPFMGEGMCTGIRDANNLAWKLDLVLRNLASPEVLHSYAPEVQGNFALVTATLGGPTISSGRASR